VATGRPLDAVELERRARRVLAATDFAIKARAAIDAVAAQRPRSGFVEQQLYDSFADRLDYRHAADFHLEDSKGRLQMYAQLRDPSLREFAARIIYDEAPETLAPEERTRLDGWLRGRLFGPSDAPWRTIAQAREELASLRVSHPQEVDRLEEIGAYLDAIAAESPH
jgi:exonuclease I